MSLLSSLITAVLLCSDAAAFAFPKRAAPNKPAIAVEQTQKKQGMTNLRFQASTEYATQPTMYHPCVADVLFQHRNSILEGTKNRVEQIETPDVSLYAAWKVEAEKNGVAPPQVGDPILRVTTTAIQFPGLMLRTLATVGCKEVRTDAAGQLQITLIDDELQASGPEPLVWVFNRLTGANKDKGQKSSSERSTHSTHTISADKTDGNVVFRSVARLVIDVSFPSLLLNLLPVSHGQAEKQGSKAIQSVVERDIGPTMEALSKKYVAHLKSKAASGKNNVR